MHIATVEEILLSVSGYFESEMTSDLCLDHIVPVFSHSTDKSSDINDMVCLQLVEAVVNGQHGTTPPHTCTAVYGNGTSIRWIRSMDGP